MRIVSIITAILVAAVLYGVVLKRDALLSWTARLSPSAEERAEAATDPAQSPTASEPARPVALAEPPKKKSFFGKLFGADPSPPKAVPAYSKAKETAKTSTASSSGETEVVSLRNEIRVARASAADSSGNVRRPARRSHVLAVRDQGRQ